jgi:serine protease inhibitor
MQRLGIVGLMVAALAGGCATAARFDASTLEGAVKASNAFGFDYYREIRKGRDNFVCSPAGAAITLTMAAAGARGETQAEMLNVLHIAPTNLDQTYASFAKVLATVKSRNGQYGLVLTTAVRAWVQKDRKLVPVYQSLLGEVFRAPVDKSLQIPPPPPPAVFHADHPFMDSIRDTDSGEILFMGRVVKPA